mgnify:FL=1
MFEIGDLVRLDWDEGYKRLGLGIVLKHYKNVETPLLVWWTKAEAHGWEDAEMLIKVEDGQ